jgi:hypothetical protein
MVDNFEQIRNLLTFPSETSFYFLEIIKRRKDNPEMNRHQRLVKDFYIYNLEDFDRLEGNIIDTCDEHNARAYFRLNLRDTKKIAQLYLKRFADVFITEDYKNIPKLYASVTGEFHQDPDKKWIVDLDGEQASLEGQAKILNSIVRLNPDAIVALLPTKNGLHIISRPFRLDVFRGEFPEVDVHKDNPTMLYCP